MGCLNWCLHFIKYICLIYLSIIESQVIILHNIGQMFIYIVNFKKMCWYILLTWRNTTSYCSMNGSKYFPYNHIILTKHYQRYHGQVESFFSKLPISFVLPCNKLRNHLLFIPRGMLSAISRRRQLKSSLVIQCKGTSPQNATTAITLPAKWISYSNVALILPSLLRRTWNMHFVPSWKRLFV